MIKSNRFVACEARNLYESSEENPIVEHLTTLGFDRSDSQGRERRRENVARVVAEIGLPTLVNYSVEELEREGFSRGHAHRVYAAFALVRLAGTRGPRRDINTSEDVYEFLRPLIAFEDQETFVVLGLDIRNKLIGVVRVGLGSVFGVEVHPREIFRHSMRMNAAGIVLAHNHPSDSSDPSDEDLELTRRIRSCGELIGIKVIDHVIVCRSGYTSIARHLGIL